MGLCGSAVKENDGNGQPAKKADGKDNNAGKDQVKPANVDNAAGTEEEVDEEVDEDYFEGEDFEDDEDGGAASIDGELTAYLQNVPLLAKLSEHERGLLAANLVERTYRQGYKMIVEGDTGTDFFIIKEGTARVTKWHTESKSEVELCLLKKGDYFGETALLNNSRRAATIGAVTVVVCFTMDQSKFRELFGKDRLNVTFGKRAAVSAEALLGGENNNQALVELPGSSPDALSLAGGNHLFNSGAQPFIVNGVDKLGSLGPPPDATFDKSSDTRDMLLQLVKNSILFRSMTSQQQKQVVDTMWLKEVSPGITIIQQGDMGEHWYVVENGSFDIFVSKGPGIAPVKIAVRSRGTSFGELALLYNAPRAATVTANTLSRVWVLDRFTFRRIVQTAADQKLREYEQFLKGVKSFEVLLDYERSRIAEALEEVSFNDGHEIVRQSEYGDTFFIVKTGKVRVKVKDANGAVSDGPEMNPGEYFGERALIKNDQRSATVVAVGNVTCLYLKRDAFNLLLGPLEDIFSKRANDYSKEIERKTASRSGTAEPSSPKDSPTISAKSRSGSVSSPTLRAVRSNSITSLDDDRPPLLQNLRLSDLKVLGTLGKGSFGYVQLVKDQAGNVYALKTISKQMVVQLGQQSHVMNEKKTMASLNHPFLTRLYASFQDTHCLYLLLEPSLGGELFTILRKRSMFDERTAKFYAAGVVLAFEHMHSKGIIFRDLKPENLLMDSRGYVKIADFGFAKKVGDGRTWTLCGCLKSDQLVKMADGKPIQAKHVRKNMWLAGEKGPIRVTNTWYDLHPNQPLPTMNKFIKITHEDGCEYIVTANDPYMHTLTLRCCVNPTLVEDDTSMGESQKTMHISSLDPKTLSYTNRISQAYQSSQQQPIPFSQSSVQAISESTQATCQSQLWSLYDELSSKTPHLFPKDGDYIDVKVSALVNAPLHTWNHEAASSATTPSIPTSQAHVRGIKLTYTPNQSVVADKLYAQGIKITSVEVLEGEEMEFAPFSVVDDGVNGNGRYLLDNGILTHNTPDYLAPEVVSGQGHGKAVDWWTLGVLIYEMLASYPPFTDEDPMRVYAKILDSNLKFPNHVTFPLHFSKQAQDIVKRLLHPKPTKRLGAVAGGATAIKNHPWFNGFDWAAFSARRLPPPIHVTVKSTTDLSHFDSKGDQKFTIQKYTGTKQQPWDTEF